MLHCPETYVLHVVGFSFSDKDNSEFDIADHVFFWFKSFHTLNNCTVHYLPIYVHNKGSNSVQIWYKMTDIA